MRLASIPLKKHCTGAVTACLVSIATDVSVDIHHTTGVLSQQLTVGLHITIVLYALDDLPPSYQMLRLI